MAMVKTLESAIVKTPGICGGSAVIAGTRITVKHIAIEHEIAGKAPDEIIAAIPHLSLAQLHDGLAYYFRNKEEIDEEIRSDETVYEAAKREFQITALR